MYAHVRPAGSPQSLDSISSGRPHISPPGRFYELECTFNVHSSYDPPGTFAVHIRGRHNSIPPLKWIYMQTLIPQAHSVHLCKGLYIPSEYFSGGLSAHSVHIQCTFGAHSKRALHTFRRLQTHSKHFQNGPGTFRGLSAHSVHIQCTFRYINTYIITYTYINKC